MIDYDEEWLFKVIFHLRGSVAVRASFFSVPAALISVVLLVLNDEVEGFWKESGIVSISGSQTWAAATGVLTILLGFRTRQALSRFWEGTGLLHQMRGEWFDSVSCCVTFSRGALPDKPEEVSDFRHTIVRLMSLCHGSALEEIASSDSGRIPTIDVFGLDLLTLKHLRECKEVHLFNRVEVILHLIQTLITHALDDQVLKIPPPILSRAYQTLSRGFVNLLNAKKITDTRFPFPYAQLISMLLMLHMVLTPIMIAQLIQHKAWAAIFTFVPIFGMFSLNFVASELENPFGNDDNDLPLAHFQNEMNTSLLMLLHDKTDHIAGIGPRCVTDFEELTGLMRTQDMEHENHCCPLQLDDHSKGEIDEVTEEDLKRNSQPPPKEPVARGKDPASGPGKHPEDPMAKLSKGMEDFDGALQSWTRLIETQIGDLSTSFAALKRISDSIPGLLEAAQAGGGASHWRKELQDNATMLSLRSFPAV
mmetsp:Transcript_56517/g.127505  ORF Transcript_56517/g.127505 Transcript_56517/m.127505 type:complete len:478 (-) Transcript_56517:115-1548(-)